MFSMPAARSADVSSAILSRDAATHVRCARAGTPRLCTNAATSAVFACALPDAP